jgi:hypothetical protein
MIPVTEFSVKLQKTMGTLSLPENYKLGPPPI